MSESIYNLIPREYYEPPKQPMHRSSHDPNKKVSGSTFGCHGSTRLPGAGEVKVKEGAFYGPPRGELAISAKNMVQFKRAAEESLKSRSPNWRDSYRHTKAPIPDKTDRPVIGITTNKNFVTANAVEAILMEPRQPKPGQPNYLLKEDYGKVPAYLTLVKEEVRRENEMIDRYVREKMGEIEESPEIFERMTEDERIDLLDALKEKWDALNRKYQKITHHVSLDTIGELRRKEDMEAALKQIEGFIDKLERASAVLIREY